MIDVNTIQELLVSMSWVTPIVIALVAIVRGTFSVPDRYVPGTSVLVGIGAGLLFVGFSLLGGTVGLIIGLTASGAYDVAKKTIAGK